MPRHCFLVTLGFALLAPAVVPLAARAQELRFEAEGATLDRSKSVKRLKDRAASGRRAVELSGRGSVRKRLGVPAVARIRVRARGRHCRGRPRIHIKVDKRRVATVRVGFRRWRRYSKRVRTKAGKRTFAIRLANPRRTRKCARRVALDSVRLVFEKPPPPPPPGPPVYQNPVYGQSFPDPSVLDNYYTHNDYWAYATGEKFPMLRSSDLINWRSAGQAMTERPSWAVKEGDWQPWAPSVIQRSGPCPGTGSPSCYVMFFVSMNASVTPASRCIGVATSTSPAGPFEDRGILQDGSGTTDASGRLLGCGDNGGYHNIDPAPFVDNDGNAYLYFSTTNSCDVPVPNAECPVRPVLSVVRLASDLLSAASGRVALFGADQRWEGRVVENPWLHKRGDIYYLLYSGGDYQGVYGMGYAAGGSPAGPFFKAGHNPVLQGAAENVVGAGGGMVVRGPHGGDWLVYHGRMGPVPEPRLLRIDPVVWWDAHMGIDGPTTTPQPERP
jgi:Glycosyl hydrolases family 43